MTMRLVPALSQSMKDLYLLSWHLRVHAASWLTRFHQTLLRLSGWLCAIGLYLSSESPNLLLRREVQFGMPSYLEERNFSIGGESIEDHSPSQTHIERDKNLWENELIWKWLSNSHWSQIETSTSISCSQHANQLGLAFFSNNHELSSELKPLALLWIAGNPIQEHSNRPELNSCQLNQRKMGTDI